MRQTRPVAKKATRLSLDDEIAHLRDLDLHGLRARWKSAFRRRPPAHLPRHLLFAVLAYRLQADELGDLDPANRSAAEADRSRWRDLRGRAPDGRVQSQKG